MFSSEGGNKKFLYSVLSFPLHATYISCWTTLPTRETAFQNTVSVVFFFSDLQERLLVEGMTGSWLRDVLTSLLLQVVITAVMSGLSSAEGRVLG